MSRISVVSNSMLALVAALICSVGQAASGDPPGRVARINMLEGTGAMQPVGSDSWVNDLLNRPLTGGDKIWIEDRSRAELHIGSAALRLGERTALQIVSVDDWVVHLRLTAGSLSIRVRALDRDDRFDIETPAGQVSIVQAGGYRLDVEDRDDRAHLAVWSGRAEVSGRSGSARLAIVRTNESAELVASDSPSIEVAAAGATDSLDLWAEERDRREDQSRSARYVSRDVVGYEALDGYGDWVVDAQYGSVWVPQVVAVDWAPYRFGYWNWIGPWGWTWIDDAPWGFAPCHYGRWVHFERGWGWAPGSREHEEHEGHHAVFAPALVAWRGDQYPDHRSGHGEHEQRGEGFEHSHGVGWVPLGFNEVYEPPYQASRAYVRASNVANTRLGHGAVDHYFNQRGIGQTPERRYVNESVPGAVTAVSRDTFTSARPVGRNQLQVEASAPHQPPFSTRAIAVQPEARSIGRPMPIDRPVMRPDRRVFDRSVQTAPQTIPQAVPQAVPPQRSQNLPQRRASEPPLASPQVQPQVQVQPQPQVRPQPQRFERPNVAIDRPVIDRPAIGQREVAIERAPQPRYMPPPAYRAPQPASAPTNSPTSAPQQEIRRAPPQAASPPSSPRPVSSPSPTQHEERRQDMRQERDRQR